MAIDRIRAERAVAELLTALGHSPSSDLELEETPRRVVEAFADEMLAGYAVDVGELLRRGECRTSGSSSSVIAVTGIFVATVCPHHLLPASGSATVVYRPGPSLVGVGTLAALVDAYARRLTLQERIGEKVVEALLKQAQVEGAYCKLSLKHACLSTRGARQGHAEVNSVALAGNLTLNEVVEATARASGPDR